MARQYITKKVRQLKRTTNHIRENLGSEEELRQLGRSFLKRPLQPIIIRPDDEVVDGNRRLAGVLLEAGPEADVPVCVTDEPMTAAVKLEIQMESAIHSRGLTAFEQFLGCRDWLALNPGATAADLAAKLHRDPSMLVRILSLSKCGQAVQQAAADGKLGPSEWYAISKAPEAEQEAMLAAKLAGASRDQLEQHARRLRSGEAPDIRVDRLKIPLGSQGRSVTIAGSNLSLEDAIEILQETLKFARKAHGENLDGKTWVQVMKQKAKA